MSPSPHSCLIRAWETKKIENQPGLKSFNLNLNLTCNTYVKYCRIWEGCCCLDGTCVNLTQQEPNKNLDQYYIILNSVYHQLTYLKNFSYDISTTPGTCYPKFSLVILFTIRLAIPEKRVKFSMHINNNYYTKCTCTQLVETNKIMQPNWYQSFFILGWG